MKLFSLSRSFVCVFASGILLAQAPPPAPTNFRIIASSRRHRAYRVVHRSGRGRHCLGRRDGLRHRNRQRRRGRSPVLRWTAQRWARKTRLLLTLFPGIPRPPPTAATALTARARDAAGNQTSAALTVIGEQRGWRPPDQPVSQPRTRCRHTRSSRSPST